MMADGKLAGWTKFIILMEVIIWVLAVLGPGYRHGTMQQDRGLIAHFFMKDPTLLQAVLVNALYLHLFLGLVLVAAWISKRRKRN